MIDKGLIEINASKRCTLRKRKIQKFRRLLLNEKKHLEEKLITAYLREFPVQSMDPADGRCQFIYY